MRWFNLLVQKISFYFNVVGGIALVAIMLNVIADIATRTVFGATKGSVDLTYVGGFEIVKYGLMVAVAFSMPFCLSRGQVVVDIFTERLPVKIKSALASFYTLFFGLFGFLMMYRLIESATSAAATGETTQDLLLPMQYIYWTAALAMGVLGLRGLSLAYILLVERDGDLA